MWLRRVFRFVHSTKFEVSSDVLATLRDLFTLHKAVVARFLNDQYDEVRAQLQLWRGGLDRCAV